MGSALIESGLKPALHHAEPIKGENRPLLDEHTGVYEYTDLVVLKAAEMPAILLECGTTCAGSCLSGFDCARAGQRTPDYFSKAALEGIFSLFRLPVTFRIHDSLPFFYKLCRSMGAGDPESH